MDPAAPSDRSDTEALPPERQAASQKAYPSDLAALVVTRWHEAAAAGQIDLPPPAASTLAEVLSICYREFIWDFNEEVRRIREIIPGLPIPAPQYEQIIATCRSLDTQARADALVQLTVKA